MVVLTRLNGNELKLLVDILDIEGGCQMGEGWDSPNVT